MSATTFSGPVISQAGFGNVLQGSTGSYILLPGQTTGIAQATATKIFTITIPNGNYSAGGTVLCSSTTTAASHIADSTRTVLYTWSVTRTSGAVAVATITIVTGATVIATSGAGGAYTLTSTLGASSVSGGATATNTFDIQVTNTGSTSSTSTATWRVECVNYTGVYPSGALSTPAPGVTVA